MTLDPIDAREFARARPPRRNPAACQWRQLLRLSLLVAIAVELISVSINPSRMMTASAEVAHSFERV
jgi:hypothetical protein